MNRTREKKTAGKKGTQIILYKSAAGYYNYNVL